MPREHHLTSPPHPHSAEYRFAEFIASLKAVNRRDAQRAAVVAVSCYLVGWFFWPVWAIGLPAAALVLWTARIEALPTAPAGRIVAPVDGRRGPGGNGRLRISPGLLDNRCLRAPISGRLAVSANGNGHEDLEVAIDGADGHRVALYLPESAPVVWRASAGSLVEAGDPLAVLAHFSKVEIGPPATALAIARPPRLRGGRTPLWRLDRTG